MYAFLEVQARPLIRLVIDTCPPKLAACRHDTKQNGPHTAARFDGTVLQRDQSDLMAADRRLL